MNIVLVGAGNLATNLGRAISRSGNQIVQIYSRTEASAKALADMLGCTYTTSLDELVKSADLYIVALKDSVLKEVSELLVQGRENNLFVHTAGSIDMDIIPASRRGVFYPMQTFSKQREVDFEKIPCFIEAAHDDDRDLLKSLASDISNSVYELTSENRKYLHLAAVFCCNFANHCFRLGEKLLKEHGDIPFEVMLPLVDETARKLHELTPQEAQTGPAVRWDENVISKQMQLLSDTPDLQHIYELLSKSIHHDKL